MSTLRLLVHNVVVIAASTWALASTAAHAERRQVAVVSYGAAAESLEPALRASLRALKSVALRDAKSTAADLATAAELGATCGPSAGECHAKLAVLMNIDLLVIAAAEAQPQGTALDVVAVDAALGRAVARESVVVPRGPRREQVLKDVTELLLEPDLHFGALVVDVTVDPPADGAGPRAQIVVDGAVQDAAATSPENGALRLRAGRHRVEVSARGYAPAAAEVNVNAGQVTRLPVTLAARAARPTTTTTTTTTTAAAAATTTTTTTPTPEPSGALSLPFLIAGGALVATAATASGALIIHLGLGAGLGAADEKAGYQAAGLTLLAAAGAGAVVTLFAGGVLLLDDDDGAATAASSPSATR